MPADREPPAFVRPVDLHVLMALARRDRHGYGIVQDIEELSDGRLSLVPGNLYTVLRRLLEWRWIEEAEADGTDSGGPPRRIYSLTSRGRLVLGVELDRLEDLLRRRSEVAPEPTTGRGSGR